MKSKLFKRIVGITFALSMICGTGFAFSRLNANNFAQIVLAEEGESENTEEVLESASENQLNEQQEEEKPAEEYEVVEINKDNILKAFKNTFKDAWDDLIRHLKKWFNIK